MDKKYEKIDKYTLDGGCPANAFEEVTVTVPVTVRAFADVGHVDLKCMGPAMITRNCDDLPGTPYAVSKFTIRQKLRVEIPVVFGAEADVGEGHIDFPTSGYEPDKCKCAR